MKELKWSKERFEVVNCDLCGAHTDPMYDSPIKRRSSWAHMCQNCYVIYGTPLASKITAAQDVKIPKSTDAEKRQRELKLIEEYEDNIEALQEIMLGDENAPTACPHGCEVEPDGRCPHGYRSILLLLGVI